MPPKQPSGRQEWPDTDGAPERTEAFFDHAEIRTGDQILRRGRPRADTPKQAISLRLDQDVLVRLRALGPGWQTRVNDALRMFLD